MQQAAMGAAGRCCGCAGLSTQPEPGAGGQKASPQAGNSPAPTVPAPSPVIHWQRWTDRIRDHGQRREIQPHQPPPAWPWWAQGQLSPSWTPASSQERSTWCGFDPHICSSRALPPARASRPRSPAALRALVLQLQGSETGGVERTVHEMGFGQSKQEEKALRIQARLSLATAR